MQFVCLFIYCIIFIVFKSYIIPIKKQQQTEYNFNIFKKKLPRHENAELYRMQYY
jgi:hypothetical protein